MRRWTAFWTAVVAVLALAGSAGAPSADAAASSEPARVDTIRVGIKPLAPFVTRVGDRYEGFSIDLWSEIARRNGWETTWAWDETITELLGHVADRRVDAGIAGISMTAERERTLDFSFPMFNSGLQIAARPADSGGVAGVIARVLTADLLRLAGIFLGIVLLAGHIIWLVERRRDPLFATSYVKGVGEGMWQAGSTLVQAGYGDRAPDKVIGRLVALLWMFTGVILVAHLTANLTSDRTLDRLRSDIDAVEDLAGKRVATVSGSTSATFLTERGIDFEGVPQITDAYRLIEKGSADAIVFDSPVLRHYAATRGGDRIALVGPVLRPEPYGIALPAGSRLREPINSALLSIVADGTYQRTSERWFGREQ